MGDSTLIPLFVSKKRTRAEKTEVKARETPHCIMGKWNIMGVARGLEPNISFNSMHEAPNTGQ